MWDWIDKQRKKSRAERTRLTFILSVVITGAIALVWGTVVLPRTLRVNNSADESTANTSRPFQILLDNLSIIADDAKKGFDSIGEAFDSLNLELEADEETSVDEENSHLDLDSDLLNTGSRGMVSELELNEEAEIEIRGDDEQIPAEEPDN